jgi:hypothetical protein
VVNSPTYKKLSDDAKANQVALNVERASRDAEVKFLMALQAADRSGRIAAGREIRGKATTSQQSTSPIPSFLAPC